MRTPDSTLDLRGQRVDDALVQADQFIDDSLLNARELVFIIHGTGALRSAVRTHLRAHRVIASWRPGESGACGDGITVAGIVL